MAYLNDSRLYATSGMPNNSLRIGFASMNEKEIGSFVKELKSLKRYPRHLMYKV
jgi:DNA-binding transcriptional MocR family regulator